MHYVLACRNFTADVCTWTQTKSPSQETHKHIITSALCADVVVIQPADAPSQQRTGGGGWRMVLTATRWEATLPDSAALPSAYTHTHTHTLQLLSQHWLASRGWRRLSLPPLGGLESGKRGREGGRKGAGSWGDGEKSERDWNEQRGKGADEAEREKKGEESGPRVMKEA